MGHFIAQAAYWAFIVGGLTAVVLLTAIYLAEIMHGEKEAASGHSVE